MPRTSRLIGGVSVNPEAFNVVSATLKYKNSEFEVDIRNLFQQIQIYEDINNPFLEVILFCLDSTNLLEFTQLNGHEKVNLRIQRQAGGEDKDSKEKFDLDLRIAEIYDYIRQEPGKQYYKLRCVSEHVFHNQTKSLRRSFQGSIGKLVKDICSNDLNIEKLDINTDTQEIVKGIYPTLRPMQCINWLLRNAYDNGTPFYFYETTQDGIQFNSFEDLIEEDSYKTYEFKPYFEHEMGSKEGYDEQARRITSLGSELGMSKLEGMSNGSYASTLHSLDIATKGYKKHFYNYDSSDPKKLNKNNPFSDHTKILDKKLVDLKEGKHYFLSRNTESYPDHVNYHEPNHVTMLKGQGHLSTMNFMTHSFSLPGDFNLTVGKKIKLEFIKAVDLKEFNDPTVPLDKYLGDEYLVTGLVHTLGPEKYTMSLKVQKDSVGRKLGV